MLQAISKGSPTRVTRKPALVAEAIILFLILPLAYRFCPVELPPMPLLWTVALYCYVTLREDPTFSNDRLWNIQAIPRQLPGILALFAIQGGLILLGVFVFARAMLFSLPRTNPLAWAAIMVLYPILSVYPQSIIYRAFLMHRYAAFFTEHCPRNRSLLLDLASAAAFGYMHLIFRNPLAVILTFLGGLLFAWRYRSTGSLATSSVEHALYGCLLFTIGLEKSFYIGRIWLN